MADSTDITVQNGDTALVPVHSKTRAKMGFCNSPLLLPFGKSTFYVPSDAVVSIPKGTNRVENASVLNQIINTKSPPTWKNYLDPDRLLLIKGGEGTSVYTTFKVIDQTTHQEEMFIRHIPPSVCEKQFPKWKEIIQQEIADGKRQPPTNERQESRIKVLDWKSKDCSRAQINPEHNNWEICKDPPKSLKQTVSTIAPGGKRTGLGRTRTAGANGTVDDLSDIKVATTTVGGNVLKTWGLPVGNNYLEPKLIDGELWVTSIKAEPGAEASVAADGEAADEEE